MDPAGPSQDAHKLGPVLATLMVVGAIIGSGIFLLPATLASIGGVSLLGWLAATVGALLLAVVFSALVVLRPDVDGVADYARLAAGRYAGFQSGFSYWVSNWTGIVAVAVAITGYLAVFLPVLHEPAAAAVSTIGVIWALTLVNIAGARFVGHLSGWVLALGAVPVLALAVLGWFWFDPALYARNWNPSGRTLLDGTQASVLLIFWAFTGMEAAMVIAAVVRRPERNVGVATVSGVVLAAVVLIAASSAINGVVPIAELGKSSAPFALAIGRMFGPAFAGVVAACAMFKAFGTDSNITLVTAETMRASAATGYFPAFLGRVDRRGTAVNALLFLAVLETATVLLTISPTLNRQFLILIDISTLLTLVMYGWCAVAVLRLSPMVRSPSRRLGLQICSVLALVFCIWAAAVSAVSELKLLVVSLGFLALTVPLWLGVKLIERRRAAAGIAREQLAGEGRR
jgi:arginine:agmatine antiporter